MSTNVHSVTGSPECDSKLFVSRFCGASEYGSDRVRIQLMIVDGLEYQAISLTRTQWAELSHDVNKAFEEFPAK
jgi:hypothetical protein